LVTYTIADYTSLDNHFEAFLNTYFDSIDTLSYNIINLLFIFKFY